MQNKNPINLEALEREKIDRRKLMQLLGVAATAGIAASVAPKAAVFAASAAQMAATSGTGFKAVAYNHINYQVADYAKVRDFYIDLFGMKCVWDDGKQCSLEFGAPRKLLREGKFDDAIASLENLQTKNPAMPGLAHELGVAYYKKGDYLKAIAALQKAQSDLVASLFQFNVAKLVLARSTGVLEQQYKTYLGN